MFQMSDEERERLLSRQREIRGDEEPTRVKYLPHD